MMGEIREHLPSFGRDRINNGDGTDGSELSWTTKLSLSSSLNSVQTQLKLSLNSSLQGVLPIILMYFGP